LQLLPDVVEILGTDAKEETTGNPEGQAMHPGGDIAWLARVSQMTPQVYHRLRFLDYNRRKSMQMPLVQGLLGEATLLPPERPLAG
jgi:hypothetical protein